jgi:hypothetical protein
VKVRVSLPFLELLVLGGSYLPLPAQFHDGEGAERV